MPLIYYFSNLIRMDRFSREARKVAERVLKMPCPFCRKTMMGIQFNNDDYTTVVRCGACMREFGDRTHFNPPFGHDERAFFERAEAILKRLDGIHEEFNAIECRRMDDYRTRQIEALEKAQNGEGTIEDLFETDDIVSKDCLEVKWMYELDIASCGVSSRSMKPFREFADEYIRKRIREAAEERGIPEFEPTDEDMALGRLGLRRPHPWDTGMFRAEDMRDFEECLSEILDRHAQ